MSRSMGVEYGVCLLENSKLPDWLKLGLCGDVAGMF